MTDMEIRAHALTAASAFVNALIMSKPDKERIKQDFEVINMLKETLEYFTAYIRIGEFDPLRE